MGKINLAPRIIRHRKNINNKLIQTTYTASGGFLCKSKKRAAEIHGIFYLGNVNEGICNTSRLMENRRLDPIPRRCMIALVDAMSLENFCFFRKR